MTGLVRLEFDNVTQRPTLARDERGFIATDGGFETAVFVSLFTDRRARPSDRVTDRRGWWGDRHARVANDQIGSLLWLLRSRPITPQSIRLAQVYAADALAWMRADGMAKTITVRTERRAKDLLIYVSILRPDGTTWSAIWDIHGKKAQVQNAVF